MLRRHSIACKNKRSNSYCLLTFTLLLTTGQTDQTSQVQYSQHQTKPQGLYDGCRQLDRAMFFHFSTSPHKPRKCSLNTLQLIFVTPCKVTSQLSILAWHWTHENQKSTTTFSLHLSVSFYVLSYFFPLPLSVYSNFFTLALLLI